MIQSNTCRNLPTDHYADFNLLILSLLFIHKTYGSRNAQSSVISHLASHLTSNNVPNYPSHLVFPTCVLPRGFTPFPEQINWCMLIGVTLSLQWKWCVVCTLMNICLSVCACVCAPLHNKSSRRVWQLQSVQRTGWHTLSSCKHTNLLIKTTYLFNFSYYRQHLHVWCCILRWISPILCLNIIRNRQLLLFEFHDILYKKSKMVYLILNYAMLVRERERTREGDEGGRNYAILVTNACRKFDILAYWYW